MEDEQTSEKGTILLPLKTTWSGNSSPENGSPSGSSSNIEESVTRSKRSYSKWSPVEQGVTLAWNDVSVYAKLPISGPQNYKRIINCVSGAVKAGSLVAMCGASGAGKSTLMGALAYRNAAGTVVEGDILINGRPIGNYLKYISGYLHQDDIFVSSLTVLEHMNIMAALKLDRRVSKNERQLKILEILNMMGLSNCLQTKLGEIGHGKTLSGGEKRRLSFATELILDPPILFCDEPTTGLDSFSAQKIVTMMNLMATNGKTIVCTIHQPSSEIFRMFSQIILMAEGRIAYMGPSSGAIEFFKGMGYSCPLSYNPADFFIKTLASSPGFENNSKQAIKRICDNFVVSDYAKEVDLVVQYEFHMGNAGTIQHFELRTNFKEIYSWEKLYWLTYRWFIEILRNPSIQILRVVQKIAIALMVGFCYFGTEMDTQNGVQSIEGAVFLMVTENTFNPMYSVLAEFPKNYPLFLREFKSGLYSPIIYYISRIISMLPGLIIEPFTFVVVAYWLSGLRSTIYAFLITVTASILTMNVSTSCGVFFSNAFDSVPSAMAYLVPFDYVLMVTSGLLIKLSTLPQLFAYAKYLSWLMYSTEAISIVQWSGINNITCEVPLDVPCLRSGQEVLDKYNFSENNLLRNLINMLVLCVTFYLLGFLCLWQKTKRK